MTMTKFSRINKQREEITMRVLEDMEKDGTGRSRRPQSLAQEGNGSRRVCPHAGRPRRPCEHAR